MPIRLVCPSCSATLSVKDEYAGRAIKCPKCAGVIPASQPGAAPPLPPAAAAPPPPPPPPPPPESAPSPFDALDDMAAPKPKATGRPTGKPVAKAGSDDDDEDAKPTRRKGRDDDDERGARKGGRDSEDSDDDDRPSRGKKKRGDDDENDDRPAKKKGGGGIVIVAILCGTLLLCCGGVGYGVYWFYTKAKKAKDDFVEAVDKLNFRVSTFSYNKLEVGETTRTQTDSELGGGRIATDADLQKVFASDPSRTDAWTAKMNAKRAIVWQNGDDYIIAAFHPTADGTARLQAKEWRPKSGAALKEGELDDAKFLVEYPVGGGPGTPVTAEVLAEAYKAGNGTVGDPKYKGKWLLVEGKVKEIEFNYSTPPELRIAFEGVKKDGGGTMEARVSLAKTDTKKGLALSPGQTVKLKCKCNGYTFGSLDLENGTVSGSNPDPNPTVTAAALSAEYTKDKEATDEKYSTKFLTVTDATVESVNGDTLVLTSGPGAKKGTGAKIHVSLKGDDNFRKAAGTIAVNSRVTVKGSYSQFGSNPNVNLSYAWVVPK